MEIRPKFSFIIPCWEQTHLLKCLLQSIVCQTYPNWEVILVHDGPNPTHKSRLKEFLNDPRFKYYNTNIRHEHWGHYGRVLGLKKATGDWVIHSNDDNYFVPILLEEIIKELNNNPTSNFVYWEMILGKYKNLHSHNQKDYGHFIPKIQDCYMDWCQFTTKISILKQFPINVDNIAADGELIEDIKHQLSPIFIDKCFAIHN